MSANSFGERFRVVTFGESHGAALGAVIDGCPAGVSWDQSILDDFLARRRPGQRSKDGTSLVSDRNETDKAEVLSGVYAGKTLGTPIAIIVRNQDARSQDYANMPKRVGHADDLWLQKFGHSDPRGGGRASGRETVARVMAGAVAKMVLAQITPGLSVSAFASQIGPISRSEKDLKEAEVEALLLDAKARGLSYGGQALITANGVPAGLGQPVFHKLKADLTAAMMSVGATSGVEVGSGHAAVEAEGSHFHSGSGDYGGLRGGISSGEPIVMRVSFKPTSSILDVAKKGRHDPCIVLRALPVLEAMTLLVLADHILWTRTDRSVGER